MNTDQNDEIGHRQTVFPVPPLSNEKKDGFFSSIFLLNNMLTPKIITLIYWLASLISIAVGIFIIGGGNDKGPAVGLGIMIGGVISARLWCELWVVIFKIHQNIKKIADNY